MNFSIQWFSGPSIEVIEDEIRKGLLGSGKYPNRLLNRIIFIGPAVDEGEKGKKGAILALKITPVEIQRLERDLWNRLVIGAGVLVTDIYTGFNDGRSAESLAVNLAVAIEDSIKLLRKAPRDSHVAEVRRILKKALKR